MKQFVKALLKGECFKYIYKKFLALSTEKLKEGIFISSDIRKLMKDKLFEEKMEIVEKEVWKAFKQVATKFLGNHKDPHYKVIVKHMLQKFQN